MRMVSGARRHVLVMVEDLATARQIERVLEAAPISVDVSVVSSIEQAIEAVEGRIPDAGLIEIAGSDSPGLSFLGAMSPSPPFPIIALLGPDEGELANQALRLGALDHVVLSPETLAATPHIVQGAVREWSQRALVHAKDEQLRHADRLGKLGILAASIAHELGTPLSVVRLRAQLLDASAGPQEVSAASTEIVESVDRMTALLRRMLDFARARPGARDRTEVFAAVDRAIAFVHPIARKVQVELEHVGERSVLEIDADPMAVEQVVLNLVINAIQATPPGGRVTVSEEAIQSDGSQGTLVPSGAWVRLVVQDTGSGVTAEDLPHLLEPFWTRKEAGVGTGLGLAVCDGIIRDLGGFIDIASDPGVGTRFTVFLPTSAPSAPSSGTDDGALPPLRSPRGSR